MDHHAPVYEVDTADAADRNVAQGYDLDVDVPPETFWFMFFSVTSIPVIVMAVLVLLGAGVKAKEINAPYWQVLKPGLRKFVIGVAIFYAGIIFMGIVAVLLLFMAFGVFNSR